MDADCLIKLTRAGLKEFVCRQETLGIPVVVESEVVDAGKVKDCDDAYVVEKNKVLGSGFRVQGSGFRLPLSIISDLRLPTSDFCPRLSVF